MDVERREANRRLLRVRAAVKMGRETIMARTCDISVTGLSLLLPFPSKVGTSAEVQFALFLKEKIKLITVTGKTTHCTLSSDEFRTGLMFTSVSAEYREVIASFCNER